MFPVITTVTVIVLGHVSGGESCVASVGREGDVVTALLEGGAVEGGQHLGRDGVRDGGVDEIVVEGGDDIGVVKGEGALEEIEALGSRVDDDNTGVRTRGVDDGGGEDLVGNQVQQ